MKFTQKQIIILGGGVVLIIIVGFLISLGIRPASSQAQKITLTIWGTDPASVFNDMATAYKTEDPGATIIYTQIDPSIYQNKLLSALAAGTGPDIFELGNRELPKWQSVLAPIPPTLTSQFNSASLESQFPSVVTQDFVSAGNVYAMPLDLDTIAMFYNKDLFDSASIVYPPKTWDDLEADIPKLRVLNAQGQITQAAVALGGSETSIENAPDLIFLLMLQNGTQMTSNDGGGATFNETSQSGSTNPGLAAFNFYLQFANSASPYYTWNDGMGDALQSFIQGKTAIMFDYASAKADIVQKAPFLNFGIAETPQPANATVDVSYPKYEGLGVSKSGQVAAAWQFILYLTTNTNGEKIYVGDTGEPPASRSFIAANLNDPNYGAFAAQALTARSWYEVDDTQIDAIMNTAIQSVLNGSNDSMRALGVAQDSVTSLMAEQ
jgi:multiple sugar transport system substrate-binding protein